MKGWKGFAGGAWRGERQTVLFEEVVWNANQRWSHGKGNFQMQNK